MVASTVINKGCSNEALHGRDRIRWFGNRGMFCRYGQ